MFWTLVYTCITCSYLCMTASPHARSQPHTMRKLKPRKSPSRPPQSATSDTKGNASTSLTTYTRHGGDVRQCSEWRVYTALGSAKRPHFARGANLMNLFPIFFLTTLQVFECYWGAKASLASLGVEVCTI